jgi:hypothetical protein
VKFVFEEKSNYYMDENGVFADTLLLSFDFPRIKYLKVKSPFRPNEICGFINYKDLNDKEDQRKLIGLIYHTTQTFEGVYDVKTNKTIIKVTRIKGCEAFENTKKYLKAEELPNFHYKIEIDYNTKKIKTIFPNTSKKESFEQNESEIVFNGDSTSGHYKKITSTYTSTNLILLNANLSSKITPGILFSNNEFGVEKIMSLFDNYELKTVSYE